ncbi:MAG: putative ABC transporter permease [Suipraeoptans sp.]
MNLSINELLWLFILYSFAGWVFETIFSAVKLKRFNNRGFLNGPFCIIYGLGAAVSTLILSELSHNLFFLFLGSLIIATLHEWIAGRLLESFTGSKWWDYSKFKFNIDGYICLQVSIFWGLILVLCIKYLNRFLILLYNLVPSILSQILITVLITLILIDLLGTILTLKYAKHSSHTQRLLNWNSHLLNFTTHLGNFLASYVTRRVEKAYRNEVARTIKREERKSPDIPFAKGCGFYKLFWLFLIGSFLGAIVEIIFCRITSGIWMSRSSLVWGQFSIVWGLGIGLFTALLYRYKECSSSTLFILGTLLGGFYEYCCSIFTEYVFGTVFWDYSKYQFNLGGRINLLYCFFWGIAAVIWFNLFFPKLSSLIELFPKKIGTTVTWLLLLFIVANITVSGLALKRYTERSSSIAPETGIESYIDYKYPDSKMQERYPNARF